MKKVKLAVVLILGGLLAAYISSCSSTAFTSAKVYLQQDNIKKAIEQLEIEVKQNPTNAEAFYLLGASYAKEGKFDKMNQAFAASLKITDKYKKDIENYRLKYWGQNYNMGVRLLKAKKYDDAIKSFETAIKVDPARAESYQNMAFTYLKKKDIKKAEEIYNKLLKLKNDDPRVYFSLGTIYFNEKQYPNAIKMFKKTIELNPKNKEAFSYLALTYDLSGNTEKAFDMYKKALKNNPNDQNLEFNLGRLYFQKEDWKNAIDIFGKLAVKHSDDYDVVYNLGNAYLYNGDKITKKRRELENPAKKTPKSEINKLKDQEKANYAKAITYLEKAVKLKPDNANAWYNLAVAYVRMGNAKKGKAAFDKADALKKNK
ncbi:TPR repeat-containing protein YrrB [bacterium BMS3Abin05]|nr:TPR repeat-containing protein YrrB [bacterium BMS3Abin05]GBE28818.1 TPR repeat-containing protein YrrB [bacterium BMS3Bbin03]HDK36528.1 tetratricopeptide repeat protein [Bacteroidota bacterium]HDL78363.1 tetratricopeptide repeat protein [Bacteroidota bacterium]HDZ12939.1 tetratricopeptide repeat protein [Bacteroidota bacterium]